jgi:hypothetical protein
VRLTVSPITIGEAQAFVDQHHRHHKAPRGALFAVAITAPLISEQVVGVAICGRPVSRELADGYTIEVTRCCTDGTKNACSALYGACRRAALALGYRRVITYTLASEPGSSLRGAGFRVVADVRGRSWSCKSRPRVDKHPLQDKLRWEAA